MRVARQMPRKGLQYRQQPLELLVPSLQALVELASGPSRPAPSCPRLRWRRSASTSAGIALGQRRYQQCCRKKLQAQIVRIWPILREVDFQRGAPNVFGPPCASASLPPSPSRQAWRCQTAPPAPGHPPAPPPSVEVQNLRHRTIRFRVKLKPDARPGQIVSIQRVGHRVGLPEPHRIIRRVCRVPSSPSNRSRQDSSPRHAPGPPHASSSRHRKLPQQRQPRNHARDSAGRCEATRATSAATAAPPPRSVRSSEVTNVPQLQTPQTTAEQKQNPRHELAVQNNPIAPREIYRIMTAEMVTIPSNSSLRPRELLPADDPPLPPSARDTPPVPAARPSDKTGRSMSRHLPYPSPRCSSHEHAASDSIPSETAHTTSRANSFRSVASSWLSRPR